MKGLSKVLLLALLVSVLFGANVLAEEYSNYPIERKEAVSFTPEELESMTAADFQKIAEEIGPETLVGKKGEGKG
ncbi:MAG: hypothetical protein GX175_04790, partial [Halanaerobiaceae bacterium]|nr:hypothetical protein [Halanaerobiaceae bacterium]